jgi:hypothetical protein
MGALAQGLFSLTVWPFYLCVLSLLVWAVNDREAFSRPGQGARREVAAVPTRASVGPMGTGRPMNLNAQPSPATTGPLPKPRPLMSTLANRAGQPAGKIDASSPSAIPQKSGASDIPNPQGSGGPSPQRLPVRPLNHTPSARPTLPGNAIPRPATSPTVPTPSVVPVQ